RARAAANTARHRFAIAPSRDKNLVDRERRSTAQTCESIGIAPRRCLVRTRSALLGAAPAYGTVGPNERFAKIPRPSHRHRDPERGRYPRGTAHSRPPSGHIGTEEPE